MTPELIAGLIAGPLTTAIVGLCKRIIGKTWAGEPWQKTAVFAIVLVVCAITSAVVGTVTGALNGATSLAEIVAVALATSQVVFRAVHAKLSD